MKTIFSIAVFGIFCISGCSTPASRYANAHPELSTTQRQILVTGEIPGGNAIQGMTKEQVNLAAGRPKKVEKFNSQEVWVYSKETGFPYVADSQFNPEYDLMNLGDLGDCPMTKKTTKVFFQGELANFAEISQQQQSNLP